MKNMFDDTDLVGDTILGLGILMYFVTFVLAIELLFKDAASAVLAFVVLFAGWGTGRLFRWCVERHE